MLKTPQSAYNGLDMTDENCTVDFPDSPCVITFVYPEIGVPRVMSCVYWNNRRWRQLLYDGFREEWFAEHPPCYGAAEAITGHFAIAPGSFTVTELSAVSPDELRALGTNERNFSACYLESVTQYAYWIEMETKDEYIAERFTSGGWCFAGLDKATLNWIIEEKRYTDAEIKARYLERYPDINLLGGLPPVDDAEPV